MFTMSRTEASQSVKCGVCFFAMGLFPPLFQQIENFRTLYCNPFFPRCKQNFCNFQNFFQRKQDKTENCPQNLPNQEKYRPQPDADSFLPEKNSTDHTQQINQPDIPPAEGEADIQPGPDCCQGKDPIRQMAMARSQRSEKSIKNSQAAAQQKTAAQPPGSKGRTHRHSRCQSPASRGSS